MANQKNTFKYTEPVDYFPKSIRKKNKIGEFAEKKTDTKKSAPKKSK